MKTEILKCNTCKVYTLEKTCPKCNLKTLSPKPAKFSIDDKYGELRRKYKDEFNI